MERPLYSIRNWADHYEIAQSRRENSNLKWVAVPNKHDGKSYKRLFKLFPKIAVEMYGAWQLIVQVASKCKTRGVLADEDGPLTAKDLSDKTCAPEKTFAKAFQVFSHPEIKWLDVKGCSEHAQSTLGACSEHSTDSTDIHNKQAADDGEKALTKAAQAEAIYQAYPKKTGKQAALARIGDALRDKSYETLLEATQAYAAAVKMWPADALQYVPDPERWFKKGRYDDDRATWVRKGGVQKMRIEKDASDPEIHETLKEIWRENGVSVDE